MPTDSRSACIAVISADRSKDLIVENCRELAAPVLFVFTEDSLQWWKQGVKSPEWLETIPADQVDSFFNSHRAELAPEAIYRAKTWGRFRREYQLSFVDLGLMPLIEEEVGQALSELIARNVAIIKSELRWGDDFTSEQGEWLLKSVFWLVSGKILRDKNVESFSTLSLTNTADVFNRVASHFGSKKLRPASFAEIEALMIAAESIEKFSSLALTTTESLAFVYENTLISKETRSSLGTHSTPSYLVDYVVGHLAQWIMEIPQAERSVFEPACGHASFLCSAMRLLSELLPTSISGEHREVYLRSRLHGTDIDHFALELARLSLTLTDIPNPNGWDLKIEDMFIGERLSEQSQKNTIFLANPPFANFKPEERDSYFQQGAKIDLVNRAAEVVWRAIPNLSPGSVFGIVLPQTFLHGSNSAMVRQFLTEYCELKEICLLPDKVFSFSDAESVIILGRRLPDGSRARGSLRYRRVRESQMGAFRDNFSVSRSENVNQYRFSRKTNFDFRIPDLATIWERVGVEHTLSSVATVGQGLIYKGRELPSGALTYSDGPFPGSVEGFVHFNSRLQLHECPKVYSMNLDSTVIRRAVTGTEVNVPQVILNYARVSRGPWRLKALVDRVGRPVTSRFITVRPRQKKISLNVLWAVLNSPVANAYAYCHLGKRDNIVGDIRRIPFPVGSDFNPIDQAAERYLIAAEKRRPALELSELMAEVDMEVIKAFEFPLEDESAILEMFRGSRRSGVPFKQEEYLPAGLEGQVSFFQYCTFKVDWDTTNRRRGQLIDKMIANQLSAEEQIELDALQHYADHYLDTTTPHDTSLLDELEQRFLSPPGK